MKTPGKWLIDIESNIENAELNRETIAEIQKEAYNEAIEDAAKNAEVEEKLGNPYDPHSAYYVVDEESILKLKK